jgi:pheromone shutdown protein TraB
MLTERDLLFADALRNAPGKKIMAIVGAAHLHGIPYFMDVTERDDPIFRLLLTKNDGLSESQRYLQKYMSSVNSS